MAEGARLESVCTGNRTGGSNPPLSAQLRQAPAPLPGRGIFMAPAIELVLVSQGAIKTQRCAKGAPRELDEIEVSPQRERAGAPRPAQSPRSDQTPAPKAIRQGLERSVQLNWLRPPDSPNHPTPQEGHWEIGESQIENHEPIWSRYHLHH